MNTPNSKPRVQNASATRPKRTTPVQNPRVARTGSQATARVGEASTGFSLGMPRTIASIALVLMLLFPLAARTPSAPNTAALVTPRLDGTGVVASALSSQDIEQSVFRYTGAVQLNQGNTSALPDNIGDVLQLPPNSLRARQVLVGQMIATSSGQLDTPLVQTGFFARTDPDTLSAIEGTYQNMDDNAGKAGRGTNGLSVLSMFHSLQTTGEQKLKYELNALSGFQQALTDEYDWQYIYNWGLGNLIVGNYGNAYEAFTSVINLAPADGNNVAPFWAGLAALRMGDAGKAITQFQAMLDSKPPAGSSEAFRTLYNQAKGLSAEALGDAQWANRDPAAAYKTYFNALLLGASGNYGLYTKWLRLALQQRNYEQLLDDMQTLIGSSAFSKDPGIHHDRARLLSFLGRTSEANAEYGKALDLGGNADAGLHVSYGEALEAQGDHKGALSQAESAISSLGQDPASSDLSSAARVVASSVATSTSQVDTYSAQQLLDANLLRARAWGSLGQSSNVDNLVSGITNQAIHPFTPRGWTSGALRGLCRRGRRPSRSGSEQLSSRLGQAQRLAYWHSRQGRFPGEPGARQRPAEDY